MDPREAESSGGPAGLLAGALATGERPRSCPDVAGHRLPEQTVRLLDHPSNAVTPTPAPSSWRVSRTVPAQAVGRVPATWRRRRSPSPLTF